MNKLFVDFINREDGPTVLSVQVLQIPEGEVEFNILFLQREHFTFLRIDGDSIEAEREGDYIDVIQTMEHLTHQGYSWDSVDSKP